MTIDALPPAPTRGDSVNFAAVADTFVAALPAFASQANAMAVAVDAAVATAIAQASAAAASATSASTSASNAASSATSASASASNAASSASTASTQAGVATTQATNAAASASAAAASAATVASIFVGASAVLRTLTFSNTNNTDATADACISIDAGGPNGGDPFLRWHLPNEVFWHAGVDNSDGNTWKLGTGTVVGEQTFLAVDLLGQVKYKDPAFTITKAQALCKFGAFTNVANGAGGNAFQAISVNGTLAGTTNSNFLATATPDVVAVSGWAMRGGAGSNPLVTGNLGAWFENNAHIVWTLEVDCNNEGSSNTTYGDHNRGVGIMVNTGSTYSPDTGIWIHRQTGAGTGPGWQRGLMIDGARQVGIQIQAMANASYPGMTPAAPGTITALQVNVSGDVQARFYINESGRQGWGSGAAAADVNLYRSGVGLLSLSSNVNGNVGLAALTLESGVSAATTTISNIKGVAKNSAAATMVYTEQISVLGSPTAGSESSSIQWWTYFAGGSNKRMTLGGGLVIGGPAGGDKGIGTINVELDIYKNNAAYTNPDYVFEHAYTGRIDRFSANDGAADYVGLRSLAEVERITRETLRLPGITDNAMGMFSRTDFLLEKTEEIFLHLFDHEKRLTALAA